jgi:hypothetical protein
MISWNGSRRKFGFACKIALLGQMLYAEADSGSNWEYNPTLYRPQNHDFLRWRRQHNAVSPCTSASLEP